MSGVNLPPANSDVVKNKAFKLYIIPNVAAAEVQGADGAARYPLQTPAGQFLAVTQIKIE